MGTATHGHPNDNGVPGEASTHEHSLKHHSHICRNCGATFTPQKGVSLVGIGIVLIIMPFALEFVLVLLFDIDFPQLLTNILIFLGIGILYCAPDKRNNVVCPHCGNADGNVGLLTPMGQKLYKDLHEKQV